MGGFMKRSFIVSLFIVSIFLFSGCVATQSKTRGSGAADNFVYTKYNIHGQQKTGTIVNASFANWTGPFQGHVVIPMNTKVVVTPQRRGFLILALNSGIKINFQFDENRMGMSQDQYIDLITSPQKVSFSSFSSIDLKGIDKGAALRGMSKNGVMAALGYPAAHKTPSLESSEWVYWNSKFGTRVIIFNESGIVTTVRD